jgi:hypothetical protein
MCPVRELGELPLILRRPLIWRKDNTSRLLARFVAMCGSCRKLGRFKPANLEDVALSLDRHPKSSNQRNFLFEVAHNFPPAFRVPFRLLSVMTVLTICATSFPSLLHEAGPRLLIHTQVTWAPRRVPGVKATAITVDYPDACSERRIGPA